MRLTQRAICTENGLLLYWTLPSPSLNSNIVVRDDQSDSWRV
jgi:hypothetical protein